MSKRDINEIIAEVIASADPSAVSSVQLQVNSSFAVLATAIEVRNARRVAGLTQAQLAARTGITQAEISRIEQGRYSPRLATLYTLARGLKTDFVISGTKDFSTLVA